MALYHFLKEADNFKIREIKHDGEVMISYPKLITSQVDEKIEIDEIIARLDLDYHCNIVLFGLRHVELIKAIASKLSRFSFLIIIEKCEDDNYFIEADEAFLDVLMKKHNVKLVLSNNSKQAKADFSRHVVSLGYLPNLAHIHLVKCPYLLTLFPDFVYEVGNFIVDHSKRSVTSVGNDVWDTIYGLGNQVNNWAVTLRSPRTKYFKDSYSGVPAFIVSAGPSLDKNIQELKKIQGRALIFSVDTSAKKLIDEGIVPDAIASIERDRIVYEKFYQDRTYPDDMIFIGPPVVDHDIFKVIEKPLLLNRMGDILSRKTGAILDDEILDLGLNAANVPFAFFKFIGCDPIIFVGQDLAFNSEGTRHFKEEQESNPEWVTKPVEQMYDVLANEGGVLKTVGNYLDAKIWFEEQIARDFSGRRYINATAGGAVINGTEYRALSDVVAQYCIKPVKPFIEKYREALDYPVDHKIASERMLEEFGKLIGRFNQVAELCEQKLTKSFDTSRPSNELYEEILVDRTDLQLLYAEDPFLPWIVQSIFFSYDINLHRYPHNHLTASQMHEIVELTKQYLNDMMNASKKVVEEIGVFIQVIEANTGVQYDRNYEVISKNKEL